MYDSKHRITDTQIHDNRKDGSGYSSNKRDWNLQTHGYNEDTSNHRKYMRTSSSSNNRLPSNSSSHQNGEKKNVKDTKKPLRVSGDWSEFKSSTGKTYFYNCKTEVSQWEKPKGWPSDESSRTNTSSTSTNNRIKKESTTETKLIHTSNLKSNAEHSNHHQNGNSKVQQTVQSNDQLSLLSNNRLPTSDDDSSRMSFSSTSSKESLLVTNNVCNPNENNNVTLKSNLSEPAISVSNPVCDIPIKPLVNGNDNKNSISQSSHPRPTSTESTLLAENESNAVAISKAEREHDIQKYYSIELIPHLIDWPSTQFEKQCLKLFDDYYGYSAKMSAAFTDLKGLKSNYRILDIKRNTLTQRLLLCQKHLQHAEEDKYS